MQVGLLEVFVISASWFVVFVISAGWFVRSVCYKCRLVCYKCLTQHQVVCVVNLRRYT